MYFLFVFFILFFQALASNVFEVKLSHVSPSSTSINTKIIFPRDFDIKGRKSDQIGISFKGCEITPNRLIRFKSSSVFSFPLRDKYISTHRYYHTKTNSYMELPLVYYHVDPNSVKLEGGETSIDGDIEDGVEEMKGIYHIIPTEYNEYDSIGGMVPSSDSYYNSYNQQDSIISSNSNLKLDHSILYATNSKDIASNSQSFDISENHLQSIDSKHVNFPENNSISPNPSSDLSISNYSDEYTFNMNEYALTSSSSSSQLSNSTSGEFLRYEFEVYLPIESSTISKDITITFTFSNKTYSENLVHKLTPKLPLATVKGFKFTNEAREFTFQLLNIQERMPIVQLALQNPDEFKLTFSFFPCICSFTVLNQPDRERINVYLYPRRRGAIMIMYPVEPLIPTEEYSFSCRDLKIAAFNLTTYDTNNVGFYLLNDDLEYIDEPKSALTSFVFAPPRPPKESNYDTIYLIVFTVLALFILVLVLFFVLRILCCGKNVKKNRVRPGRLAFGAGVGRDNSGGLLDTLIDPEVSHNTRVVNSNFL